MTWDIEAAGQSGPYSVSLKKDDFVDEARIDPLTDAPRKVPIKVYAPEGIERAPVVLWSHGFGGNRDGAAFLSRYLASHGYMIVHMTHHGTDSSLWEGKPGHPWDILRKTKVERPVTLQRFYDVPFVLDQLPGWIADIYGSNAADFVAVGMSGHSFGALSTQVAVGQHYLNENDELSRMKEERIRAGILYSPVPIDHLVAEEISNAPSQVYESIDIPVMHMTGTEDANPISGVGYEHRFVIFESAGHKEQYLLIKEGGDHMVYNGTRGKLEDNPKRDKHEEIIRVGSLAFWDAYLKNDRAAKDWLRGGGMQDWLAHEGKIRI